MPVLQDLCNIASRHQSLTKLEIKKQHARLYLQENPFKSLSQMTLQTSPNNSKVCNNKSHDGNISLYTESINDPELPYSYTIMRFPKRLDPEHRRTEVNTNGYDEYFDMFLLNLITSHRDLVLSPKVYIGTQGENPDKLLSDYITRADDTLYKPKKAPMFPYMLALMIAKAEHDPGNWNYLPSVSARGYQISARIDHSTNFGYDGIFPSNAENCDLIFKKQSDNSYKKLTINPPGREPIDVWQICKGKDDDYMLFMRGICDFAEMPDRIIHGVFDNFLHHAREGKIEINEEQINQMRNTRIALRDTAKEYFKNEISRFRLRMTQKEYPNFQELLKDIDWSQLQTIEPCRDIATPSSAVTPSVTLHEKQQQNTPS
jgi:hypothetical protein